MSLEVKNLPCELEFRYDLEWEAVVEVTHFENGTTHCESIVYDADDPAVIEVENDYDGSDEDADLKYAAKMAADK